jgi:Subtilase family
MTRSKILGLKPTFNGNSADPANYNFDSGTSFAAPHVCGAVALVKSNYSWENYLGIKDRILMGVDHFDDQRFDTRFRTKGRLNLARALHKRTLLRNISTRAFVGSEEQVLIGGFTISGATDPGASSLKVCVRGLGPSVGVSPVLANPTIQIFASNGKCPGGGVLPCSNDDWQADPNSGQLVGQGYDLRPKYPVEAAMVRDLAPGAYTVVVSASPGTSNGIGLVEIYELSLGTSERSRLVNLSTRCFVGTGDNVAIAGTIIGEPIDDPALPDRRILMLGRGPSLSKVVSNPLPDPVIELRDSQGSFMGSNDTWTDIDGPYVLFTSPPLIGRVRLGDALEEELVSAGFFAGSCGNSSQDQCNYPAGSTLESALWPTLRSGSYTAILSGTGATPSGIGLIEFYEY